MIHFYKKKKSIFYYRSKKLDTENKYLKDVIKNLKEKNATEVKSSASSISSSSAVFKFSSRFNNNNNVQNIIQPPPPPQSLPPPP